MSDPITEQPAPTKPGWKSTEFIGHVLISILGVLVLVGVIHVADPTADVILRGIGLAVIGGSQGTYALSRGKAKGAK
jgi:hypothetical protein